MTFQRENRYIVIKRKDLDAAAAEGAVDASFSEVLDIVCDNLPTRECLVIESDWPEYEPAWRMIQARVDGPTLSPAHIEDEREAFKAWCSQIGYSLKICEGGNGYQPGYGSELWSAWLARAALSAPPAAGVPEGVWSLIEATVRGAFSDGAKDYRGCMHERLRELKDALSAAPTQPASEQQRTVVMPAETLAKGEGV